MSWSVNTSKSKPSFFAALSPGRNRHRRSVSSYFQRSGFLEAKHCSSRTSLHSMNLIESLPPITKSGVIQNDCFRSDANSYVTDNRPGWSNRNATEASCSVSNRHASSVIDSACSTLPIFRLG